MAGESEDEDDGWYYAGPTLEGFVQRGHGIGMLRATRQRTDPETTRLVYSCIARDHRWWWQLDSRSVYLARLVRDLKMDTAPIVEQLWREGRDPEDPENAFDHCLSVLSELSRIDYADSAEQLRRYIRDGDRGGHVAELEAAQREARAIEEARGAGAEAKTYDERPTPSDIPGLVAEVQRLWDAKAWCPYDHLIDELARFGPLAADALPVLKALWWQTPHSYERASYLAALVAIDPEGSPRMLHQGLLDCEEDVRLFAVRNVPLGKKIDRRILRYLRDDPLEAAEVRSAAADRLAG